MMMQRTEGQGPIRSQRQNPVTVQFETEVNVELKSRVSAGTEAKVQMERKQRVTVPVAGHREAKEGCQWRAGMRQRIGNVAD